MDHGGGKGEQEMTPDEYETLFGDSAGSSATGSSPPPPPTQAGPPPEQFRVGESNAAPPAPAADRRWWQKKRFQIPIGFVLIVAVINSISGDDPEFPRESDVVLDVTDEETEAEAEETVEEASTTTTTELVQATTTEAVAPVEEDLETELIVCRDGTEINVFVDSFDSIEEARLIHCGSPESEQWKIDVAAAGFENNAGFYIGTQIDEFSLLTCELLNGDPGEAWLAAATQLEVFNADSFPPLVREAYGQASVASYCP